MGINLCLLLMDSCIIFKKNFFLIMVLHYKVRIKWLVVIFVISIS